MLVSSVNFILVEPALQLSWGNVMQGSPAREGTEGAAPPTERVVVHDGEHFSQFGGGLSAIRPRCCIGACAHVATGSRV